MLIIALCFFVIELAAANEVVVIEAPSENYVSMANGHINQKLKQAMVSAERAQMPLGTNRNLIVVKKIHLHEECV